MSHMIRKIYFSSKLVIFGGFLFVITSKITKILGQSTSFGLLSGINWNYRIENEHFSTKMVDFERKYQNFSVIDQIKNELRLYV